MQIEMPTANIPTNEENLSPALAAMVATITMPQQYARFVADAVANVNVHCQGVVRRIDK